MQGTESGLLEEPPVLLISESLVFIFTPSHHGGCRVVSLCGFDLYLTNNELVYGVIWPVVNILIHFLETFSLNAISPILFISSSPSCSKRQNLTHS